MSRNNFGLYFTVLAAAFATSALAADAYTILNIEGQKISSKEAEAAWKSLFPEGAAPEFEGFDEDVRQNVLRGLVSESLLYQEAKKAGVPERESIKTRLRNLEKQITIQAYIEELSASFVNEQAIRKAYAEYTARNRDAYEVRARHILVESQEKAEEVAAKLKTGTKFEKLAQSISTDKGSAASGGDLGYFTKDKMVPEFSEAAFDLKPGEVSDPVKSDFGWHVIKVEDRRKVEIKSLEEVQEILKAQIRKEGVERYVDQLIEKANIKYYSPSGKSKKLNLKP